MTVENFLELFTTMPFLLSLAILGWQSYTSQILLMLDVSRLFLYSRYTKNIDSEIKQEQMAISLNILFITCVMSFFT